MTINQMMQCSEVEIAVKVDNEEVKFNTFIMQSYKEPYHKDSFCIGVEPITNDGKIVSFGKYPVSVCIRNKDDNREYNYKIKFHGLNKDKTQLLLFSADDVNPINHRQAYRVACSYKTVVQIGNNKKAVDGHLHDISISGIGMTFLTNDFKNVSVGQMVSASIFDNEEHVYKVVGNIVRTIEDFDDKRTLIGVQFNNTPNSIIALVTNLQRQELRLRKKRK